MPDILAIAEQRDGALRKTSQEVIAAAGAVAGKLGGKVHVLLAGPAGTAAVAAGLGGAEKVFVLEHEVLAQYNPEALSQGIADHVRKNNYNMVVFGGSSYGKDVAPRVAAKLDVPLATDVTALDVEGDELIVTRPVYAGRAIAKVAIAATPRIVSVRPNAFRAQTASGGNAAVETIAADNLPAGRLKIREVKAAGDARVDVAEAPIVVSGGRGLKGPENWHLLEGLRDALGSSCALGASRAVVDAGWRPHGEQVGQTGKTVSPQLYFAVGISGAMQHLAGMRTAKTIVAINKDPDAPIFKIADYGIVGDVTDVLPRLIDEIKNT